MPSRFRGIGITQSSLCCHVPVRTSRSQLVAIGGALPLAVHFGARVAPESTASNNHNHELTDAAIGGYLHIHDHVTATRAIGLVLLLNFSLNYIFQFNVTNRLREHWAVTPSIDGERLTT